MQRSRAKILKSFYRVREFEAPHSPDKQNRQERAEEKYNLRGILKTREKIIDRIHKQHEAVRIFVVRRGTERLEGIITSGDEDQYVNTNETA